jgi:hypothetical protein
VQCFYRFAECGGIELLANLVERETLSALVTYKPLTRAADSATADRRVMENVSVIFELDLQDSILSRGSRNNVDGLNSGLVMRRGFCDVLRLPPSELGVGMTGHFLCLLLRHIFRDRKPTSVFRLNAHSVRNVVIAFAAEDLEIVTGWNFRDHSPHPQRRTLFEHDFPPFRANRRNTHRAEEEFTRYQNAAQREHSEDTPKRT